MKPFLPISIAGVDHRTPLDQRADFSFTQQNVKESLAMLKRRGIAAVLLSTCNRTELCCTNADAYSLLNELKNGDPAVVYKISGWEAATHLFRVAVGLESLLIGEDQILGQVKSAIELSQELGVSDSMQNQLYRCAVSAAKEVKQSVALQALPVTAPSRATEIVAEKLGSMRALCGIEALVIGNGQMGRMAANELLKAHANVKMTRRYRCNSYSHNQAPDVPGASYIDYESRFDALRDAKLVFSATASPHLTLTAENISKMTDQKRIFVDLAVPRDIDPQIGNLQGQTLIDIDDIAGGQAEGELPALEIWSKHEERFERWLFNRSQYFEKQSRVAR